jgi:hypothetical protein
MSASNWVDWLQRLNPVFELLQAMSFIFTSIVAWKIYSRQKTDSDDQRNREVRFRLTQAYYSYDSELLQSRENLEMARELLFPTYSSHQVQRIMFMYAILDVLYLDWKFQEECRHSGDELQFRKNLDAIIGRIVKNLKDRNGHGDRFLIDKFEDIFFDFPDGFKTAVRACITSHMNKQ